MITHVTNNAYSHGVNSIQSINGGQSHLSVRVFNKSTSFIKEFQKTYQEWVNKNMMVWAFI